ncbi:MAG: hypothetical protein GWO07_04160 [Candidatus Dadabacteria bacterium]|nr:hypothetical protein [Candidatus Dadabacteria bacterium]NIS07958.1 hypothetical protein [Candidatus Dadabacteria bacterium]NIV43051.1 hypothetical protein [Candidatus Dadabacteria bacterium]NIX14914.1 hypothetical protein [Candidatus Dadabacteria bacterium]NIY21542.1 hypothetical protein [Candidatus Dadabacteria bacterium]
MLDILFSKPCVICSAEVKKSIICHDCFSCFSFIDNNKVCDVCGIPISAAHENGTNYCGSCISKKNSLLKVRSVLLYKDKLKDLLHEYKYGSKLFLAEYFSDLIEKRFPFDIKGVEIIAAVPLNINRLR